MPDKEDRVTFAVTEDHVKLLKGMRVETRVSVNDPGDRGHWGLFSCRPGVNAKRPFGNSGEPAACVLEELGIEPDGRTGAYSAANLSYARMLLAELPVAYEAVMLHGSVEPCVQAVDRCSAWFGYRSRRALEYWREALEEAAGASGMDAERLVEFAMNARNGSPVEWAADFEAFSGACGWMGAAWRVVRRHLAEKYRGADPGAAGLSDDRIVAGLLAGDMALRWPGQAVRPGDAA